MLYFDRLQTDTNSKFSDCSYIIGHLNSIWTYILLLQVSRHTTVYLPAVSAHTVVIMQYTFHYLLKEVAVMM